MAKPLVLLNSTVTQVADVIMDNYAVPRDLLEQFGRAFACRAATEVADFAEDAAEEVLRQLGTGLDDKTIEKVSGGVWRAVMVALEDAEWRL